MISQVRPRPNHYQVLGLEPGASDAEIKRAFASRMSLFGAHRPGEVPQISAAFATLRDPARRRDYDRSLGLNAKAAPQQWGFAVAPPRWTPFVASAQATDARQPAPLEADLADPHVTEPPADPRLAAIAASVRELAKPALEEASSDVAPQSRQAERPETEAVSDVELFDQLRVANSAAREGSHFRNGYRFNWRRPGLAIGGLIVGAGLFGTLAGLSVKDNAEAAAAGPAVSIPLPPAGRAPSPAAPPAQAAAEPEARVRTANSPVVAARATPQRPSAWPDQIAENLTEGSVDAASDQAAEAPAAAVVAASLPLPKPVIARTIERIGYACGEVASTAPAETPGVFTVNCTSGQAYQAKPVRGRYHFRRLGGR